MRITDPWVLPKGIVLVPVEELPARLRKQVDAREGDFAISRPQSRTPSRILDRQSVALLKEFEIPKTIGEAIAHYSRSVGANPEHTLEGALPMLMQLIEWQLLVPPESEVAEEIRASFQPGATPVHCEVLQCLQALEDSEIYQVRRPTGTVAALKMLRPGSRPEGCKMFDREAEILRHLGGTVCPALLDSGVWKSRPYLLLEWCEGVDASAAAGQLHQARSVEAQKTLLDLCCRILGTYSELHQQGVIHSDIHPRNILVDEENRVKLVDFGLARHKDANRRFGEPSRGGVGFFFEPEYAASVLKGLQPPGASELGEQYALAALLYSLLTGTHYVDFSLTKTEMMRQILQAQPVTFAQRGVASSPQIEGALNKALSKDPAARFASVSEFADALRRVEMPDGIWLLDDPAADPAVLDRVLDRSLRRVGFPGNLVHSGLGTAPKASLTYGAAGIAYALYRIACSRQDPSLLSLADVWCRRAVSDPENGDNYYNPDIEITPEIIGQISPYHTLSGVHAVQALVSHAMCDAAAQAAALEGFMATSQRPCDNIDLVLGRSGTLLISSLLLDTLRDGALPNPGPLIEFGNRTASSVWQEIDKQLPVREGTAITYLGIAHGWAGILYAVLNWHRSSGAELPPRFAERLQQLAECAEPSNRGIRWPWVLPQGRRGGAASYMPGWCNGSAGYIFLWTAAHGIFHDDAYLRLAERTAWHTWESPDSISNLCCGLAGRAYGLLNLYKYTGESTWRERAARLALRAGLCDTNSYLAMKVPPESLYKGEVGVAVLAAELPNPQAACMPFFEPEGWASRTGARN